MARVVLIEAENGRTTIGAAGARFFFGTPSRPALGGTLLELHRFSSGAAASHARVRLGKSSLHRRNRSSVVQVCSCSLLEIEVVASNSPERVSGVPEHLTARYRTLRNAKGAWRGRNGAPSRLQDSRWSEREHCIISHDVVHCTSVDDDDRRRLASTDSGVLR